MGLAPYDPELASRLERLRAALGPLSADFGIAAARTAEGEVLR